MCVWDVCVIVCVSACLQVGTRISQQEQQENKTKRRVTLGGMIGSTGAAMKAGVSGAASVAIMPVTGLAMGVGALGHGAMAGASALGSSVKGMQFHVSMGSGTPLKDFNTSNFVLVSMQEFAEGGCLGDASSAHQVCRGAGNESSFVQVDLDSSAQRADDGGEAYVSGNASANSLAGAAPHGPRASRHALQQLDWSLSSQTMELLCLVVLQSTKLQGRGHGVLRKTIDGSVPQGVPDAQVAVYQTRMLLSIVRFLMNETDRDLILANTKLAINICKLCEYLVDKMYCGWLVAGHQDVLRFCLHGIESVQNHSVYSNLYRGAAAASWKAALYILSLAAGPVLSKALEYISENFNLVLNATGMDQVACCQVFKCLTDVLLMEDSAVKRHSTDDPALLPNAAKVAGQMLSVNSPHTRSVLIGLLVYKPSMTAKLFRKGEKEKAIDLMKNGFDKLCGSESVSTLNPLRAWWKPGDHLDDFRIWALDGANKSGIRARLSEALEASSKDWRQRCARTLREDLCALAVRSTKEAPAAKREAAAQRNLLAAVSKREVSCLSLTSPSPPFASMHLISSRRDQSPCLSCLLALFSFVCVSLVVGWWLTDSCAGWHDGWNRRHTKKM